MVFIMLKTPSLKKISPLILFHVDSIHKIRQLTNTFIILKIKIINKFQLKNLVI